MYYHLIMEKIQITVVNETNKAYLVTDGARQGWVMNRSLSADNKVNKTTFEKACAEYEEREAIKAASREADNEYWPVPVLSETEKAVKVPVRVENVHLEQEIIRWAWFPKSQIRADEGRTLVPGWLIRARLREIVNDLSRGSIARLAGFEVGRG